MAAPTIDELNKRKKAAEDELKRIELENQVKELEKKTKRPSLAVGVLRVYVKGAKAIANLAAEGITELSKPNPGSTTAPTKKKAKKK